MNHVDTPEFRFTLGAGVMLLALLGCSSNSNGSGEASSGTGGSQSNGTSSFGGHTNQDSSSTGGTKASEVTATSGGTISTSSAPAAGGSRAESSSTTGASLASGGTARSSSETSTPAGSSGEGVAAKAGGAGGVGTTATSRASSSGGKSNGGGTSATASGGKSNGGGTSATASGGKSGGVAGGGKSSGGTSATASGGASSPGFGTVKVEDLNKSGPYTSTTALKTGPSGNYTIYRPQELAPGGAKNPVVVWVSGGGSTPDQYDLLPHLASHGFVVIASNTSPQVGTQDALGKEMVAAVDWIVTEAARTGSDYNGKVDATKIAAMGYSMGGLASMSAAGDPRWTTTVHISGGAGDGSTKNLHAPAAFICGPGGSGGDIAGDNCAKDFDSATTPVFYGVFNGGDHLGVRTSPYKERIRAVVTGWLRWQLMNDATLKSMFVGADCTVCTDPNWTVKEKNLN